MVYDYIKDFDKVSESKKNFIIDEIAEECGTDWIVGTPPDRMMKGMNSLGIKYVEFSHFKNPFDFLKELINRGNLGILRTITQGIPHWIIIAEFTESTFKVLDPWLGEIEYTNEELDKIWKLRDYQFFEINIPKARKNENRKTEYRTRNI
jgi:ABC-type bacteriocin/lantibiotic exporter with double-glycine peptidase domain